MVERIDVSVRCNLRRAQPRTSLRAAFPGWSAVGRRLEVLQLLSAAVAVSERRSAAVAVHC